MIWTGEFYAGKLARFDPATQTFKEYPLPGPTPLHTPWVSIPMAIFGMTPITRTCSGASIPKRAM